MKKFFAYIIIFIFLCSICSLGIDYTIGKQIENQSPYYLSFASIGANSLESRMDCWAKLKTTSTEKEMKSIMEKLLINLGLSIEPEKMIHGTTRHSNILRYEACQENHKFFLILESDQMENETYLALTIMSPESADKWPDYKSKLNQFLGISWNYYYLYTGCLDNVIDSKSQEQLLQVVMQNLQAKVTETYQEGNTISLTGYSPVLEKKVSSVEVAGKKYNVQAASRASQYQGKTYIYIGSPLILGNY